MLSAAAIRRLPSSPLPVPYHPGVVRPAETMVAAQILEDALRRQTRLDAPHDLVVERRAQARRNPGGHPGWFWVGPEPDAPRNLPAVKLQHPRDTPVGDALPV